MPIWGGGIILRRSVVVSMMMVKAPACLHFPEHAFESHSSDCHLLPRGKKARKVPSKES